MAYEDDVLISGWDYPSDCVNRKRKIVLYNYLPFLFQYANATIILSSIVFTSANFNRLPPSLIADFL